LAVQTNDCPLRINANVPDAMQRRAKRVMEAFDARIDCALHQPGVRPLEKRGR
jgi:hypothetical protein